MNSALCGMRTVRKAGVTYLVDLKLCTGNEDTPVVVDEVNADQGAGETSDGNADEGAGER